MLTRPVHALSLAEAVALAGELPHLHDLLHADASPVRTLAQVAQDRDRVRRVLHFVQGHPKLLELADAAAADPDQLDRQLAAAEAAAPYLLRRRDWDTASTLLEHAIVRDSSPGVTTAVLPALSRWQLALDLNAEIAASTRRRGAGEHELAQTRFNDAASLIELGWIEEAGRLLRWCQQVFEDHRDTAMLATVLGNRAGLEARLGHGQAAADFRRVALRLGYARPDPRALATRHHNLAGSLGAAGGDRAGRRAHRLAAALICRLTGMAYDLAHTMRILARELSEDTGAGPLPATVAEVVAVAERTEGVRLGDLLAALEPDPRAVEAALAEILRTAADLPPDEPAGEDIARHLKQWEPIIAIVVAACQGNRDAATQLIPFLDKAGQDHDWAALAGVLRGCSAASAATVCWTAWIPSTPPSPPRPCAASRPLTTSRRPDQNLAAAIRPCRLWQHSGYGAAHPGGRRVPVGRRQRRRRPRAGPPASRLG